MSGDHTALTDENPGCGRSVFVGRVGHFAPGFVGNHVCVRLCRGSVGNAASVLSLNEGTRLNTKSRSPSLILLRHPRLPNYPCRRVAAPFFCNLVTRVRSQVEHPRSDTWAGYAEWHLCINFQLKTQNCLSQQHMFIFPFRLFLGHIPGSKLRCVQSKIMS